MKCVFDLLSLIRTSTLKGNAAGQLKIEHCFWLSEGGHRDTVHLFSDEDMDQFGGLMSINDVISMKGFARSISTKYVAQKSDYDMLLGVLRKMRHLLEPGIMQSSTAIFVEGPYLHRTFRTLHETNVFIFVVYVHFFSISAIDVIGVDDAEGAISEMGHRTFSIMDQEVVSTAQDKAIESAEPIAIGAVSSKASKIPLLTRRGVFTKEPLYVPNAQRKKKTEVKKFVRPVRLVREPDTLMYYRQSEERLMEAAKKKKLAWEAIQLPSPLLTAEAETHEVDVGLVCFVSIFFILPLNMRKYTNTIFHSDCFPIYFYLNSSSSGSCESDC